VFEYRAIVAWFVCICVIWNAGNGKVFHNNEVRVKKLVEEVKNLSWNWLKIKANNLNYTISKPCLNLGTCLCIVYNFLDAK